ncbi:MAG: TetR/AcrR family transcriptional regulator [Stackebrandtia sp.]
MAGRTQGVAAGLSRGRIAAAAVALIDRDGLQRFGVRRLAEELGVDPMSIYNHIKGKAALLDAVSEAVLAEVSPDIDATEADWGVIARRTAHSYRATVQRHPQVIELLATRPQNSAPALEALERLTTAMRTAGLPDDIVADAPMILFSFLNGYLLAVLDSTPTPTTAAPELEPTRYPTMAALAPRMVAGRGSETEFDRMLDVVLGGFQDRRAHPGDRPAARSPRIP